MATITGRSWYDLVSMQASAFQQLMSQQAAQMGGTAGSVFQQLGGQGANPYYGYPNASTVTSGSSTWTFGREASPSVAQPPVSETGEPGETPHKHLQRRVNKWLNGVELPLH